MILLILLIIYIASVIGLYLTFKYWWYGEDGEFPYQDAKIVEIIFVFTPFLNTIWTLVNITTRITDKLEHNSSKGLANKFFRLKR